VHTSLNCSSPRKPPAIYSGSAHSSTSGASVSIMPSGWADETIACCCDMLLCELAQVPHPARRCWGSLTREVELPRQLCLGPPIYLRNV